MNAQEKRSILETNGYRLEDKKGYAPRYRWFDEKGLLVGRDDSLAISTDFTYRYFLGVQSQLAEAAPTVTTVSEAPAIPSPLAELQALREENAKLRGDLDAAKAIIVKAGQDFEALKAERVWLVEHLYLNERAKYDAKFLQAPTPVQAPSEAVTCAGCGKLCANHIEGYNGTYCSDDCAYNAEGFRNE